MTISRIQSGLSALLPIQGNFTVLASHRVRECTIVTQDEGKARSLLSGLPSDLEGEIEEKGPLVEVSIREEVEPADHGGRLNLINKKLAAIASNKRERFKKKKKNPWR